MIRDKYSVMNRFVIFSITLFIIILVSGTAAFMFSMRQIIRENKGVELSQMLEIERIELEKSVLSDISLVLKLADSPLIINYFQNPGDPELRELAIKEIESYRKAFSDGMIFWVNDIDRMFYSSDNDGGASYEINPDDPDTYWYNMTLHDTEIYNFNINYNPELMTINLWINAPIFDEAGKAIGIIGTGIGLTEFIESIYRDSGSENVRLYFFNAYGEISGARDIELVVDKASISDELGNLGIDILETARKLDPREIKTFNAAGGKLVLGTVPSLDWYSVAFAPDSISDYNTAMTAFFLVVIAAIFIIFVIFNIFIARFLKSLRETMKSLEIASKSKSDFLAVMSHEIRTPMNAIIGAAQIQMQKENLSEEYSDALDHIYSSGKSLLGIINDILDMSKIETGKLELISAEYDVPSMINDAVQINIVRIGAKPIEFVLEINENLPLVLYGDELRLKQILNNLLSNAIKYTQEGQVKLYVGYSAESGDESEAMLHFTVSDTGQGMKPEDSERLFTEYMRFNLEANRTTEGTGIGLNITKRLVGMMDGTIRAESEYGKGSSFMVTVRQKTVEGSEPFGAELVKQLCNFKFHGNRHVADLKITRDPMPYGSVLVVDDVETNLYVAKGLLAPYKLAVETVTSGFAAIEKINGGEIYDIVFMDHMMPKMDGMETTKRLRESGYSGAIVALTANAVVGQAEVFLQNGFDDFISKPIDMRQLDNVLNGFVRDRQPPEVIEAARQAQKIQRPPLAESRKDPPPELLKIFARDAKKALQVIDEAHNNIKNNSASDDDWRMYVINIHAMKSALANIGEHEASGAAAKLERLGRDRNADIIRENTKDFLDTLEAVAAKAGEAAAGEDALADSDPEFLRERLEKIIEACEEYEETKIEAALAELKEKQWTKETRELLEKIAEHILHSDFEEAAQTARDASIK